MPFCKRCDAPMMRRGVCPDCVTPEEKAQREIARREAVADAKKDVLPWDRHDERRKDLIAECGEASAEARQEAADYEARWCGSRVRNH